MRFVQMILVGAALVGCAEFAQAGDRHVVIISIDGFAASLLDDRSSPVPTIRHLAKDGAVASGGMTVINPSVTWPNHSTLITGVRADKHGVLANGMVVRGGPGVPVRVDAKRDQKELLRAPNLIDAARAAGLRTAEINWPCTRGSTACDDSFPDTPDQITHMTPRLRDELIELGLLADDPHKSFMSMNSEARDDVWTDAACHVIRTRKPHLLLLHLLNVDATHHGAGPATPEGYAANGRADGCVARVLSALDEAGIRDHTTVFVVADHGFSTTPQAIRPNALLRQNGLLTLDGRRIATAQVQVIPEGGVGFVYCTDRSTVDEMRRSVKTLFEGREGVAEVILPEDFETHGLPHPRRYDQAPDAVLVASEGHAVSDAAEGDAFVTTSAEARTSLGSHGLLATVPSMNALCVISGCGVRPGTVLVGVAIVDIAPTAAALLGLKDLPADGRVLDAALTDRGRPGEIPIGTPR